MKQLSTKLIFFMAVMVIYFACASSIVEDIKKAPQVDSMLNVTNVTLSQATLNGKISSDGGATLSITGFCCSTTANPDIETIVWKSSTPKVGDLSTTITDLKPNTTYYVKLFATNAVGTTYSEQVSFKTSEPTAPILKTLEITEITEIDARCSSTITSNGGMAILSRGICWSESPMPTIADHKKEAATISSGFYTCTLSPLKGAISYYVRAYATNEIGISYGEQLVFKTPLSVLTMPVVMTDYLTNVAKVVAVCGGEIRDDGGSRILEQGICWSLKQEPTVADNKTVGDASSKKFYALIEGLSGETTYYVRAYATNKIGTAYGQQRTLRTTKGGNVRYVLNKVSGTPTADQADAYKQITIAMDSALYYFNNYTSLDKYLMANYSPGVPTADCNSEGWMRFGTNRRYMYVGTAMHETAHAMGSGTSAAWTSMIVGGIYQRNEAVKILRLFTGDPNVVLKGDNQHFWPGGINQREEVKSERDLIMHAMMLQAMKNDGL